MQDESRRNEVTGDGEGTPITVGPIGFDPSQWAVTVDGQLRRFTPVEYKILHFLAVHADTVCTFDQIGSYVFGYNDNGGYMTIIKSKIRRIRSMIEPNPLHPIYLLTVPERGYMLVSHDQGEARES